MGRANLGACAREQDVVVTAACDVQEARLEATVETFKPRCKGYVDYREMLQQPDLDAVIIATPPHWHCLQAIAACEAGKDIYLQKPMTLHLGESLAVRNAVDAGRGKELFGKNCAACHGNRGEGGSGPALKGVSTRLYVESTISWIKNPSAKMPRLYPSPLDEQSVVDISGVRAGVLKASRHCLELGYPGSASHRRSSRQ